MCGSSIVILVYIVNVRITSISETIAVSVVEELLLLYPVCLNHRGNSKTNIQ